MHINHPKCPITWSTHKNDFILMGKKYRTAAAEVFVLKKIQRCRAQALLSSHSWESQRTCIVSRTSTSICAKHLCARKPQICSWWEPFCSHGHIQAVWPAFTLETPPQTSPKSDANYKSKCYYLTMITAWYNLLQSIL